MNQYRTHKEVAAEIGLDLNELRFLVQYTIGESARPGRERLHTRSIGRSRFIDDNLYKRLKELAPIFIAGRDSYRDDSVGLYPDEIERNKP